MKLPSRRKKKSKERTVLRGPRCLVYCSDRDRWENVRYFSKYPLFQSVFFSIFSVFFLTISVLVVIWSWNSLRSILISRQICPAKLGRYFLKSPGIFDFVEYNVFWLPSPLASPFFSSSFIGYRTPYEMNCRISTTAPKLRFSLINRTLLIGSQLLRYSSPISVFKSQVTFFMFSFIF